MTGLTLIRRLDDWSSRVENFALAVLHGTIALLVCAAVVFRYVLSDPLTWSEELILILFGWMIFLGIANAFHARTHIIIDVIVLFAPRWLCFAFGLLAFTATAVVLGTLTFFSWRYLQRELPNLTPMLGISAGWAIAPLFIGSVLSLLHLLRNLIDEGVTGVLWSDITTRE
ncbi:TRAP transporter small permease [Bosea sp. (in: a-proteobacteria)]|jgi:TRAP-type C4-dicarboxylate transport system permease small subunit|uniref:TRAP transporter small permease n=1 Tax=Bosea sp. (in: a-proteobacteria) TaxID=1871050 RepID=UPI002DDD823D|nr:TRAP transporter small permease [Bosea sp. (in: a-proteobacteria)]HEV2508953.1 TRAP transporter small permease [Bosea sp. (in: a-proteobacteria)]